jgi:hypothetical protein
MLIAAFSGGLMTTQPAPTTRLIGRTLAFARMGWLALAALLLVYLVMDLWFLYHEILIPCVEAACVDDGLRLTPDAITELETQGLAIGFYAAAQVGLYVVFALVFCALGALIFWHKSHDRAGLFVSFCLFVFGGTFPDKPLSLVQASPLFYGLAVTFGVLGANCFYLFFFIFPNGHFVPRWTKWVALALIFYSFFPLGFLDTPLNIPIQRINSFVFPLFLIIAIIAQIHRYRWVSSAIERQQTRWVLFGIIVGLGLVLFAVAYTEIVDPAWLNTAWGNLLFNGFVYAGFLLVPLSLSVAVVRSRLYDIDLIIRRTLQYTIVTVILALIYFASIVVMQQTLRGLTGQEQTPFATVLSTLTIAALFTPLRRWVQNRIDRRFNRRKYDAEKILTAFSATLRDEVELDKLTGRLVTVVEETMQPAQVLLCLWPPNVKHKM